MSKSWHKVIFSCEGFWKKLCRSSGVRGELLVREKQAFGEYSAIAIACLQQKYHLKNHLSFSDVRMSRDGCAYKFVRPVCNGFVLKYPNNVPSPCLTLLKVDVERDAFYQCGEIRDIFPYGHLDVLWSRCTGNRVLLHSNNAIWAEFLFPSHDFHRPPIVTTWEDTGVVSRTFHEISSCGRCPLVVTVRKKSNEGVWEMKMIELKKSSTKVVHYRIEKKFLPEPNLRDDVFFKVMKIHLCSSELSSNGGPGSSGDDVCPYHSLLVQFGSAVVQFRIEKSAGSCYAVSDPTRIMCPFSDPYFYRDPVPLGSFGLSQDGRLLGLVTGRTTLAILQSHIWNLESESHCKVGVVLSDPTLVDRPLKHCAAEVVSVGDMYYLVMLKSFGLVSKHDEVLVFIMETATSRKVAHVADCRLDTLVPAHAQVHAHSPGNEEWLSTVSGHTKSSEHKPLFYTTSEDVIARGPASTLSASSHVPTMEDILKLWHTV